jgi:chemotaxis protein MotA
VGRGIAVAFVSTIYGVASANIFFLPAASKLKARAHDRVRTRELTLESVLGIAERVNQRLIRMKLEAYLEPQSPSKKPVENAAITGAPSAAQS